MVSILFGSWKSSTGTTLAMHSNVQHLECVKCPTRDVALPGSTSSSSPSACPSSAALTTPAPSSSSVPKVFLSPIFQILRSFARDCMDLSHLCDIQLVLLYVQSHLELRMLCHLRSIILVHHNNEIIHLACSIHLILFVLESFLTIQNQSHIFHCTCCLSVT